MQLLAPAKINLHLRVGAISGDGFHPVTSWMCKVGLFDTLVFDAAPAHLSGFHIDLGCDDPSLPVDRQNLVVRAAEALARAVDGSGEAPPATRGASDARTTELPMSVSIVLQKRIPAGGGLGGGSSDAACTLIGLNRRWQMGLDSDCLRRIGANLGSDVPFFLGGSSSVCTGRGEIVTPAPRPQPRGCVLILPPIQTPTPAVYRRFDELNTVSSSSMETRIDWQMWAALPADDLMTRLRNDLEPAAFNLYPALAELQTASEALVGQPVRMSGSGSSLFTLFDELTAARRAADQIAEDLCVKSLAVELAPVMSADSES